MMHHFTFGKRTPKVTRHDVAMLQNVAISVRVRVLRFEHAPVPITVLHSMFSMLRVRCPNWNFHPQVTIAL